MRGSAPLGASHTGFRAARRPAGRRRPYTLEELGELLPKSYRLSARPVTAIGRNVSLFQTLMRFAGRPANREAPLMPVAESINAVDAADMQPVFKNGIFGVVRSLSKRIDSLG